MKNASTGAVLSNPIVLAAFGILALIAAGSVTYYLIETRAPEQASLPAPVAAGALTGTGVVEPAQNPDLAFEVGGRVTKVAVSVGDAVTAGKVLATLDSSTLAAQRAQAVAAQKAEEAKLLQMQGGPRQVDISAKQTAVSQAQLSLQNAYGTVADVLNDAYGKTYGAVHTGTDALFSNPDSANPTLIFTASNSQATSETVAARTSTNQDLANWKLELSVLSSNTASLESALTKGLSHLSQERDYANSVTEALASAISTTVFTQSSINASIAAAGAMRDVIAARITALQTLSQQIAADKLAVQSAQNALDQTLAGSTKEEIAAQAASVDAARANVASLDAQIAKTVISAPFGGTVSSVRIKKGDNATPDTPAISLTPSGALQVSAYFSETDAAQIATSTRADVTLDAYGSDRVFPATVSEVDRSPTQQNGVPAYKVTLQFDESDPAISPGMTANVTIKK
jgi:HlyD family secretion protein